MKLHEIRLTLAAFTSVTALSGCSAVANLGANDGGPGADAGSGADEGPGIDGGGDSSGSPSDGDGGLGDGDAFVIVPNAARVFRTSATYSAAALGGGASGVAGADGFCAAAAAAASLGGNWVAWLSTSRTSAISRVTGRGPWYLVDRATLVFPNLASIASVPRVGIGMNELGVQSPAVEAWTGTSTGGTPNTYTCNDWSPTANATASKGMVGVAGQVNEWTRFVEQTCDLDRVLYCFEVQ